jgi:ABC-type cobalamin transport system ATPase subunit
VRNPPDVEQERKNLDYTLRACEYIKRIEQLQKVRDKLEPRLKRSIKNLNGGEWTYMNWNAIGITDEQSSKPQLFIFLTPNPRQFDEPSTDSALSDFKTSKGRARGRD